MEPIARGTVNTNRRRCPQALILVLVLAAAALGGCVSDAIPYRVSRTWFDQNWDCQRPGVQVGGVDENGWMHFVVSGGPVTGETARMDVSDVWIQEDTLFIELRYSEPPGGGHGSRRIARLELEVLSARLPNPLDGIQLVTGGVPINVVVTATDAVELVRGELATTPLGLSQQNLANLATAQLLLVRLYEHDVPTWRWYVELAEQGGPSGDMHTVQAVIDAATGEILELVVNK